MNAEDTVFGRGAQRDQLAAERFSEANATALEMDVAFLVGLADKIVRPVFDGRQSLRKGAKAWPVTLAGRCQIDRLMGPLIIVDVPPPVEGALTLGQVREVTSVQDLGLERAMEAFVLALRLGVIGPPMRHPHAQTQQPHREC